MTYSSLQWASMTESDGIGGIITFVSAGADDAANELLFLHQFATQTPNGTFTVNPNNTSGVAYFRNNF